MTNEIKTKIEAIEGKIAKATVIIEKNELKMADLASQAAEVGIIFPAGVKNLWSAIREEVEKVFVGRDDELNRFYWGVIIKFEHMSEQTKSNEKKIAAMRDQITKLLAKLEEKNSDEISFDNLPQIIKDFIENWRIQATEYYLEHHDNSKDDVFRFRSIEQIEKQVSLMAHDKGVEISYRVNAKCGKIIDGSGLYLGDNGTINGKIIGEKGSAIVETILAGGYNVQCLHFRVLVK